MKLKSRFKFNKQERSGIFFFLLILISLQGVHYLVKANPSRLKNNFALNIKEQAIIDSLKTSRPNVPLKIFPFNPNFLSDAKGYTLGLSTAELDRLFVFRNQGKFVNSAEEFQEVTKISDSLLKTIAPYFKFPDWVGSVPSTTKKHRSQSKTQVLVKDLNTATASDLMAVYGIGETLSKRIVKFRDRLGGFLVDEQLYDVYGLKPEVVQKALLKFKVKEVPTIKRININKASAEELAQLVYIPKSLAHDIVEYRGLNGVFRSFQDLKNIEKFPSEKLDRIALYLSL